MRRCRHAIVLVFLLWGSALPGAEKAKKQPIYMGVRTCAVCHDGAGMGHQCSLWMLSKHAQAYAVLAKPESREIARLSGIPQEPQESPTCLGCHATGAHAEDWEKDDGFRVQDGVQCEKCHGRGSEYMDAETMKDRAKAVAAGLHLPTMEDCLVCHREKGSHVAVHKLPALDVPQGLKMIAHPAPKEGTRSPRTEMPAAASQAGAPAYVGAYACAACHGGASQGYQFSKWRMSEHARAFAVLATQRAEEIAAQERVKEPPQTSSACLKCHSTGYHDPAGGARQSWWEYEGVGCEACHGAGSVYAVEAVMTDAKAARAAGLKEVTQETCLACHQNAHGKPFDYPEALARIAHPTKIAKAAEDPPYKTPLNLAVSPDGREVYITCEASHAVIVVDVASRAKVAEIAVGGQPTDVAFLPDGTRAYVSNRLDDSVSVIDPAARKVVATIPVGDEPHGVMTDGAGRYLYVLNTSADSISVIDTGTLQEVKRLSAGRGPWALARSPDGARLYVTHTYSNFIPFRAPLVSEVAVIDAHQATVTDRFAIPGANLIQGVAWHPSGAFALVTLMRTKNNIPMTRLLQGWTITNGLGIIWRDGRVDQVLLDEPGLCFPDPAGVVITPDGRYALVISTSSNRIAVVDVEKLISLIKNASDYDREHVLPNHLGKPTEFIVAHIQTGCAPRGIIVLPDGRTALTADSLDDSLSIIDVEQRKGVASIDLGGPGAITKIRYGERVFHSANITFHREFSCHSCHPDGHVDGITYDTEPDGIGVSPVDNRTLRGILDTAPFKWEGTNPNLARQCGPRLAVFFTRIQPFTPEELAAVDNYICTIPRPPNRYRPLGAELTEAQRKGKEMFERTTTNDGRTIPPTGRCVTCHSPPLYTDRNLHDVGTRYKYDRQGKFDTPHLNNIYDSAPYLHNGMANTLEEIWTRFNPEDKHGVTNDMTKDQLNNLIEYIKTL
jgi:YVTN family beta-propeller protein